MRSKSGKTKTPTEGQENVDRRMIEKIYGRAFLEFIEFSMGPGEHLLEAIPAVSEELARIERSDREGTLGVTNHRLIFIAVRSGRDWYRYGLLNVVSATLEKAGLGNRYLTIGLEDGRSTRFMVGTKQGERFLPALQSAMTGAREIDKKLQQMKEEQRNKESS